MSGSLNLRGDLGTWTAATANNSLTVNQSTMSVSFFVQVNSITTTGISLLFGYPGTQGFKIQATSATNIRIALVGVNSALTYDWPIVLGATVHIGISLVAAGTSAIYIDGIAVTTKTNIGATLNNPLGVQIGWPSTSSSNVLISDPAILDGVALAAPDYLGLRDRTLTPLTTSTPFTSWWTCQGTSGTNPTASASGLSDQIGSNNFITLTGTSTYAIYSATTPTYHAPVTAVANVGRSGGEIFFSLGTNPLFGPVTPVNVTAVATTPTALVNGVAATLVEPYWSSVNQAHPHVAYQIVGNVLDTDVVTWTTVNNWISAFTAYASSDNDTAGNYTGSYEPGLFGYPGFNFPNSAKTYKCGFNLVSDEGTGTVSSILKNIVHRCAVPWFNADVSDPTGYPTHIMANFSGTTNAEIWASDVNNGIDARSMPSPMGTWSVVGDETNSSLLGGSPMIVSLTTSNQVTVNGTIGGSGATPTAGTLSGTVEVGKRWDFDLAYVSSPTDLQGAVTVKIQRPSPFAAGPNTLTNLRVFEPGNAVTPVYEHVTNGNLVRMLTASTGVYAPIVRFLIGNDGGSSITIPSDLPAANLFDYSTSVVSAVSDWTINDPTYTGARQIPIYAVRAYDVTVSPYVYSAQAYKFTVASNISNYPYMWNLGSTSPGALNLGYDWGYFTAASPQPKDWLLASCGSPRDGKGRPGPEPSASCRGGLAHWCQSRSFVQASFATWGARSGTQTRPRLRSWPLDRRSGCSSAKPYPPPRPIAIVVAPRLGANHPTSLSRFRLGKSGAAPRCVAAGLVSGACSLGFWPRPSKTVLPLAGITDTGPACKG